MANTQIEINLVDTENGKINLLNTNQNDNDTLQDLINKGHPKEVSLEAFVSTTKKGVPNSNSPISSLEKVNACQQSLDNNVNIAKKPLIRVIPLERLMGKPHNSSEINSDIIKKSTDIFINSECVDDLVNVTEVNPKQKINGTICIDLTHKKTILPHPVAFRQQKKREDNRFKLQIHNVIKSVLNKKIKFKQNDNFKENVNKATVDINQIIKSDCQKSKKSVVTTKSGRHKNLKNTLNLMGISKDDKFRNKCFVRVQRSKLITEKACNKRNTHRNKRNEANHSVLIANIAKSEVNNPTKEVTTKSRETKMRRSRSSSVVSVESSMRGSSLDKEPINKSKPNIRKSRTSSSSSVVSVESSMRGSSLDKEEEYESSQSIEKAEYSDDINSSDSEVIVTRKKRVYKKSSNDGSSSDFESPKKGTNKKRVIIKATTESSEDDGEGSPLKRKKIRKLIKTRDLDRDTKRAAKEEEERRKRIEERQKKYNEIYEKPENVQLNELVLDFDEANKTALLSVDSKLIKLLKPHQASGVKFMWDACFETLSACVEKPGSGCILAHCMGLGKTLQVITLTHTLLVNSRKTNIERALIISPLSTLTNWAREYHHWMKNCHNKNIEIYDMSKYKDKNTRVFKLDEWFQEGGVCIMGYDMFRILSNEKTKGLKKKQREALQKSLIDPGPDIVVCDEGHLLKNEKTSLSKAVTRMKTKRRIVLTGTPLQNNLKEYYCMIQFIKPNLLGTYKEYLNRFVNPITNGQYTDSTDRDIRLMKHRSHILHKLLQGCIQRKDYSVLAPYLPPKHEYVVYVQLTDLQKNVYQYYMTKQRELFIEASNSGKGAKLFQDFQNLRRIWTHPKCLRVNSDIVIKKKLLNYDSEGSLKDFIVEGEESSESSNEDEFDCSDDSTNNLNSDRKTVIRTRNNKVSDDEVEEIIPPKQDVSEWWMKFVPDEELNKIENSSKLMLLMTLLEHCEALGDKILVFSQSLQSLDVIEHFLAMIDARTRGHPIDGDVKEFKGYWVPEVDYFRLDGSKNVDNREIMCRQFNNPNNLRARLFLISTRAGGLGINLVAANRVVIFDVSWNPSHDTQSIFRVYRFGQNKPCYIYRLIAMGTMEQKVYERQVAKQATAKRVIDEQQISRHYNQSDLQELYSYELTPQTQREIPKLPKDRLFAELLSNFEQIIFKYHEHDSLLENEISENLTEEERKAAWAEYEDEKVRPAQTQQYVAYNRQAYGNYGSATGSVTSNKIFGFRTDVLVQLLNMKVKQDNPQLNTQQVVQMVPLYLQQLYTQMNMGDPTLYKDLLELHKTLEMPRGMYMNPLLFANQNVPTSSTVNPMYSAMPMNIQPTSSNSTEPVEIYEID